jgi:signal transduction histidine kinase
MRRLTPTLRRATATPGGTYSWPVPKAYPWLRGHPTLVDGMLAAVLFLPSLAILATAATWPDDVVAGTLVFSAALAATVVPRRSHPEAAFAVAIALAALQVIFGIQPTNAATPVRALEPGSADVAILVLVYTLAAYRPRRISVTGLAVTLLAAAAAISRWAPANAPHPGPSLLGSGVGLGGSALIAWVLGDHMAYRRAYLASLEHRAERAEAERDAQARIAAAAERARELQERRARAVDESASRLRRIERDLHDGAQVRLAALALALGEIKENLEEAAARSGDDKIAMLVGAAHENAKQTLAELRDLARGIHPAVLDRGLDAALAALAEASATPVALSVSVAERPSPAIESIAYFCAAELLANVTKHSGASRATISVSDQGGRILMTVTDDGAGGARLAPGGGLAGLLERVQTVDGTLEVDSPPGGPTFVTIELPVHA